ncbi:MAG: DNA repair protein RecO [Pseudomonadota bacterium]|jgi:DNA repair protein RecO (recombination protein O)|nr:DNA repair protein RecO [Pseudomonadota bacterium]
MRDRVDAAAAYVLHSRPYRETSLLVDLLTLEHGKVSVVARGARRPSSRLRATLQPFQSLQVGWQGRTELKTLRLAEPIESLRLPQGAALLCGLYLNELLARLLRPFDPHPRLFLYFRCALDELRLGQDLEGALRTFEGQLLEQLGYGLDTGALQPGRRYRLDPERGLVPSDRGDGYPAEHLLAIAAHRYADPAVRRSAKRLMRNRLTPLLGERPLRSRELFLKRKGVPDE